MDFVVSIVKAVNDIVWGVPMLALILGTGLLLTIGLRFMPILKIGYGFKELWKGRKEQGKGDISPFDALMTSLSATIGTGNIAGVATAIFTGGPGALFWMWCTALVGMATKFGEAVLALRYREVDEEGNHVGGPMYYIKNGLGEKWHWMAILFAAFGAIAGFGIGNGVQANSVADVMDKAFGIPDWVTGILLMVLVGLVLIGGIRRIATVAGMLVPVMAIAYLLGGLTILIMNISKIPDAINLVLRSAFTPVAASGGFKGALVWSAIRFGVARGVFSNEAGLGSAPMAHAAARTNDPVRQGTIAMLGTFIDTLIICSITGLVIVTTNAWTIGENGAALSATAFNTGLPVFGKYIVTLGLAVFSFTTLMGWSYYGERCVEYLFGTKSITPFRIAWILAIPIGAIVKLDFIWLLADTLNALMAAPNLVALIILSPVIFKLTRDYFVNKS